MSLQHGNTQPKTAPNPQAPVGGSVIDQNGKEITITEEMIQQACDKLEKSRENLGKKS
ncbi:PA1571 family protein [Pseudomonas sp. H9]|uniref:PA1571 family protein n=1 Tax=Pseudomonas sp. H9 TaxID=483968 RepID=UPI0014044F2E|nr:PA1571 family protein [Pseudomonas sp. H9]